MSDLSLEASLVLVGAGLVAGWINAIAGAGGVVLVPALLWIGLDPHQANGSLRVAIIAGNLAALSAFRRAGLLRRADVVRVVPPAVLGALAGALTATHVPAAVLEPLLLATFAVVVVAVLRPPPATTPAARARWLGLLGLLGAGFYGGLVQIGVGLILLAVLAGLMGIELVVANALKVVATLAFNLAALGVYVGAGEVVGAPALVLAGGALVGGALGGRMAVRGGRRVIQIVVVAAAIVAAVVTVLR